MADSLYEDIPGLSEEERAILKRQRLAEAMIAQSQQPVQPFQQAGRLVAPMAWTQGLAQMAQAYAGKRKSDKADKGLDDLAQQRKDMIADALTKYRAQSQGGPVNIPVGDVAGGAPTQMQQSYKQDQEGATFDLLANPAVSESGREAAKMRLAATYRSEDRKDAVLARLEERKLQLEGILANTALQGQQRADLQAQHDATLKEIAALTRANRPEPAPIVVTDEAGHTKFYDRQGNLLKDAGDVGKPSVTFEKTKAQRKQLGTDLDRAIGELETATNDGGLIDQSTGSGAGALADKAAGFFGHATEGAIAAGSMAPIYDLVLKMVPRFEGPQSDKDTQSYREAAGQLANPAIPNDQKKAAGREILRLMKERRDQFVSKDMVGTETDIPATGIPSFATEAEAEAANLESGTKVIIGGVSGTWH